MKKILSLIFAFILIFSCFAVTVCAADAGSWIVSNTDYDYDYDYATYTTQPVMSFSEDFQKFYVNDEPFSRVDVSMLTNDFGYKVNVVNEKSPTLINSAYIDFDKLPQENIKEFTIHTNYIKNKYLVEVYYNDGSILLVHFLQDSYLEDYNNVVNGKADQYLIDFNYPDGNIVITNHEALLGKKTTINKEKITYTYDYNYVDKANKDLSISARSGAIFTLEDGKHYYIDFKEAGIEDTTLTFGQWGLETDSADVPIYEITDEKLIADIDLAWEQYYADDFGLFYDETASEIISAIFLTFIFAVIPAVIFVIFLIKAIRGKGLYRKLYITAAVLCILEIIIFIILAILVTPFTTLFATTTETILGDSDSISFIVAKITNTF